MHLTAPLKSDGSDGWDVYIQIRSGARFVRVLTRRSEQGARGNRYEPKSLPVVTGHRLPTGRRTIPTKSLSRVSRAYCFEPRGAALNGVRGLALISDVKAQPGFPGSHFTCSDIKRHMCLVSSAHVVSSCGCDVHVTSNFWTTVSSPML